MQLFELLTGDLRDQVKAAIDSHNEGKAAKDQVKFVDLSEGGYVSKGKYDALEGDYNTVKAERDAQAQTIEALKKDNKGNEGLQKKLQDLTTELETVKAEGLAKTRAYKLKDALREAGCTDMDYIAYKLGSDLEYDDDGNVKDLENKLKDLKADESLKKFFKAEEGAGYNPKAGGTPTANPFAKDTFDLTKQSELMRENPAQAKQLAAEAGISI